MSMQVWYLYMRRRQSNREEGLDRSFLTSNCSPDIRSKVVGLPLLFFTSPSLRPSCKLSLQGSGKMTPLQPLPPTKYHTPVSRPVITEIESEKGDYTTGSIDGFSEGEEEYILFPPSLKLLPYFLGLPPHPLHPRRSNLLSPHPHALSGFSVPIQPINLTVTIYAICQAISPFIGRRPVFLCLITLYAFGSLGLSLNSSFGPARQSYEVLIAIRSVQSLGGVPYQR
ncbi:hypothetical protein QBC36DRAFT_38415 [Triangularia setosa]|uniref:Uncharacterized protein n=1 Tax=Triangularia setosa TaxID=2587417 RepID=A0AAN6W3Q2_9PEZI|nr:hypothetical protein QBC36DRAFT_38415 [Podospora setosa]